MRSQIGQETGGSKSDNKREVVKLLDMIDMDLIKNPKDLGFVIEMRKSLMFGLWSPSGKQLFRLRDIKDSQL